MPLGMGKPIPLCKESTQGSNFLSHTEEYNYLRVGQRTPRACKKIKQSKHWEGVFLSRTSCSGGSQLPCCEQHYRDTHVLRNWTSCQLPGSRKACQQPCDWVWKRTIQAGSSLEMTAAWPNSLNVNLWETLSQNHPAKMQLIPDPQKLCGMINICCFKLLKRQKNIRLGVVSQKWQNIELK